MRIASNRVATMWSGAIFFQHAQRSEHRFGSARQSGDKTAPRLSYRRGEQFFDRRGGGRIDMGRICEAVDDCVMAGGLRADALHQFAGRGV